ncbi:MAG: TrmH family RNA methyltransferase [Deltaproteobacteria bacterium]|nr:TrmH family RNA methyltransferase [Deltaproteobacteria bacterium]
MKRKRIYSRHNPDFKRFLTLLKGKGIRKHGLTLLSGSKQVGELLRDFPERCEGILSTGEPGMPAGEIPPSCTEYLLGNELYREMDIYGTGAPILLARIDPLPKWSDEEKNPGSTLFVPFQDPVNVGAVIRSAAAFGVSRVVMLREAAGPFHHKATRVAGSAVFRVSLREGPSIRDLGACRFPVFTLSPQGKDVEKFRFPEAFGLLPGLEGPGIPPEIKHLNSLAVPMEPGVESLNASVATGIVLYLWRRQISR